MDGERSKGKDRRVYLGGKICSILCRASCFALVDLEETVEFRQTIWKKQFNPTFSFQSKEIKQL